jgi:hypothetical protein
MRQNKDDPEIVELYTQRQKQFVLWGVVHSDFVYELGLSIDRIDDYELDYKPSYVSE